MAEADRVSVTTDTRQIVQSFYYFVFKTRYAEMPVRVG